MNRRWEPSTVVYLWHVHEIPGYIFFIGVKSKHLPRYVTIHTTGGRKTNIYVAGIFNLSLYYSSELVHDYRSVTRGAKYGAQTKTSSLE